MLYLKGRLLTIFIVNRSERTTPKFVTVNQRIILKIYKNNNKRDDLLDL